MMRAETYAVKTTMMMMMKKKKLRKKNYIATKKIQVYRFASIRDKQKRTKEHLSGCEFKDEIILRRIHTHKQTKI